MIPRRMMRRYLVFLVSLLALPTAQAGLDDYLKEKLRRVDTPKQLDAGTVAAGLRQALEHGTTHAVETASPAARQIFVGAIRKMTIQDALGILNGPPDAATRFFRTHTAPALTAAFRPIVMQSTESVGATAHYKRLLKRAEPLGLID